MAEKPKKISSPKRQHKTSNKKIKTTFKKSLFIIVSVLLVIALVVFGYFLGQKSETKPMKQGNVSKDLSKTKKPDDETKRVIVKPQDTKELKKPVILKDKEIIKDERKKEKIKKEEKSTKSFSKEERILLAYKGNKPKLVIVIDDVHTKKQLKMIQNLKMKITPSIFPSFSLSKKSHLLAKDLKHYMIHLPMESKTKKFNRQTKTLMKSFSDEQIADRVMELRTLFPTGKYVNNHTGSVFTSNYGVMKKLYTALRIEGFVFVDSFTKASSKVEKIADEYGDAYVRRDSFIDNVHTVKYIKKKLQLAVKKAKKKGYAIAIGHPHKVTMQALKHAKSILKDVELVYIDEIYRRK
ncbi:MAG: divergent polysaccharide deacetylase family protein [Sulfurovum sp.]|nr:divergent polysaccharide deacetylase family protein [Sulfurovum sp.]